MPQLENGYTKIADELLDALAKFRIPGVEMQCLLFIIRKTYGYNKKEDWISNSQFVEATGLKKQHVSRSIKSLIKKKLVTKKDDKKMPSYQFNKKYTDWVLSPKKVTSPIKVTTVTNNGSTVTNNDAHSESPILVPTIDTNIQKTIIQKRNEFFDLKPDWFSDEDFSDMLEHRKKKKASMTERAIKAMIKQVVLAMGKGFTVEECVDEYAQRNWIGFKADWMKKETGDIKINSVHQAKIVEDDGIARVLLEKERRETEQSDSTGTHLQVIP